MELIAFLIVGFIAGLLARAVVPGKDPLGIVGTLILGVAGALLGGFVAQNLFNDNTGVGIIGATLGAVVLLLVYRAVTRKNSRSSSI